MCRKISILILLVNFLSINAQDKNQINNYLNSINKRFDSLTKHLQLNEAENQRLSSAIEKQNQELIKSSYVTTHNENKIDSLSIALRDKSEFMDSQDSFLTGFMVISAIALFAII